MLLGISPPSLYDSMTLWAFILHVKAADVNDNKACVRVSPLMGMQSPNPIHCVFFSRFLYHAFIHISNEIRRIQLPTRYLLALLGLRWQ